MGSSASQMSRNDGMLVDLDDERHLAGPQPRSFEEYLTASGYSARSMTTNAPVRGNLARLVEKAKRTPRIG